MTTVARDDEHGAGRELVGQSAAAQELFKRIVLLADNDLSVLIQGESGTGKELVARAIHRAARAPRTPVRRRQLRGDPRAAARESSCSATSAARSPAPSRAHAGASSWPAAGTLFLDEIGELPLAPAGQAAARARRSAASSASAARRRSHVRRAPRGRHQPDLAAEVEAGRFREDLFYRLNVVTITVPPLRERREDIPELVESLLREANREADKSIAAVEQAVLERLKAHDWPGNVRELEHVIRRSVLAAKGSTLTVHDLSLESGSIALRPAA